MLIEEWRRVTIPEFSELYEVSDLGRVRSLDRIRRGPNGPQRCDGKILRARFNRNGYPQIILWNDGRSKTVHVHRLVAAAFVPNPNSLPLVNHIDGVKAHCAAINLEWSDDRANKQHAIDTGLISHFKKLLTHEEAREIRGLAGTMTQAAIANRFGTTQTNVSLILLGKTH